MSHKELDDVSHSQGYGLGHRKKKKMLLESATTVINFKQGSSKIDPL